MIINNHKLEVRNVKTFTGMEGQGFNANLYLDGVKVAFVIDDAQGGDFDYQWVDEKKPRVDVRVRDCFGDGKIRTYKGTPYERDVHELVLSLPKEDSEYSDKGMYPNLDITMDNLINEYGEEKQFKRLCKKKTCFKLKENKKGEFFTQNIVFSPLVAQQLRNKYGDNLVEIYNERYA